MAGKDEMSDFERENRRKNLVFGIVLFVIIIILNILLGMAGIPVRWGPA
jgi:hypothetical protein